MKMSQDGRRIKQDENKMNATESTLIISINACGKVKK